MEDNVREQPFDYENEDTKPLTAVNRPVTPNTAHLYPANGEVFQQAPHYPEQEAPSQRQDAHQQGPRFSRRQILVAGGAAAGLVVATSLGILEVKNLLQGHGQDHPILGSLLLGNIQQQVNFQPPYTTPQDMLIFSGQLADGWSDWSWGQQQVISTPTFTDGSAVIDFSPTNWGGVYLSHDPIDTTGYSFFSFGSMAALVGGSRSWSAYPMQITSLATQSRSMTTFRAA
jgi:hypothetical protein